jgi:PII-like signaling protein
MVEFKGTGKLLRILVGADDRYKGRPLFEAMAVIEEMLEEVGCGSMMTLEKVEIIRYKPGE